MKKGYFGSNWHQCSYNSATFRCLVQKIIEFYLKSLSIFTQAKIGNGLPDIWRLVNVSYCHQRNMPISCQMYTVYKIMIIIYNGKKLCGKGLEEPHI